MFPKTEEQPDDIDSHVVLLEVARINILYHTIIGPRKQGQGFPALKDLRQIDIFPNWQNSLRTVKLQMIGHALLSTNFDTLHSHLPSWSCGRVQAS